MQREKARPRRWWQSWDPDAGRCGPCNPLAFSVVALPGRVPVAWADPSPHPREDGSSAAEARHAVSGLEAEGLCGWGWVTWRWGLGARGLG